MFRKENLLAFSTLWLLISLSFGYAFAQFIAPDWTEAPVGLLGWSAEKIPVFNWRAFILCFSILYLASPLVQVIGKSWVWALVELGFLAISAFVGFQLAHGLELATENSGFLGFNGVLTKSFRPELLLLSIFVMGSLYLIARFILEHRATTHLGKNPAVNLSLFIVGLLALGFFFVGVHQPVFHSTKFWFWEEEVTLVQSVEALMKSNEIFVGTIVLVFTLIFPIIKFLYMFWALLARPSELAFKINKVLSLLGKFSMIDVFVLALLLLNLKFDTDIIDMELRTGVVWFSISVILNMIVTAIVVFRKPYKPFDS